MESIGYGYMYPTTTYANFVVFVQSWWSVLSLACITGFIYAKIARPSRLKRMIVFSRNAVVNYDQVRFVGNIDHLESGRYAKGEGEGLPEPFTRKCESKEAGQSEQRDVDCPCLVLRMANAGRTQLCGTQLRVLLIERPPIGQHQSATSSETTTLPFADWTSSSFNGEIEGLLVTELNFEVNRQIGRVRAANMSSPILPLPWTIVHAMDRHSPLYRYSPQKLTENRCEIIVLLDATNEAVSDTFQARFSYVANEIVWNARFVDVVQTKSDSYIIDFSKFHDVEMMSTPTPSP